VGREPCFSTGTPDATAPAPRRSDDAITFATARSSNNGDGVVPPQPYNV